MKAGATEKVKEPSLDDVILDELHQHAVSKLPGLKQERLNQRVIGSKWMLVWSWYWESMVRDDYGVSFGISPVSEGAARQVPCVIYVTTSTMCGEHWTIDYADDPEALGELASLRAEFSTHDLSREQIYNLFDRLLDLTIKDSTPQYKKASDKEEK